MQIYINNPALFIDIIAHESDQVPLVYLFILKRKQKFYFILSIFLFWPFLSLFFWKYIK